MVHAARLPARVPGFIELMPLKAGRLDFNRIFGYATAIAVHAVLFLLLLVPITAPPSATVPDKPPPVWIIPVREIPPPTPPTVPVKQHPRTTHTPTAIRQPVTQTPPVLLDHARPTDETTPRPPPEKTDIGDEVLPPQPPRVGMQLEYAQAPAPTYPRDALRDGVEGTVMLKVLVDVDGRPLDVQIEHSSGNRSLDRAAREQVLQRWRFRPAMQDGRAVQAIGLVPVDFRLN